MKTLQDILLGSYEDRLIFDDNWYTSNELDRMYPMHTLYCLVKKDKNTKKTLYQPKVITTFSNEAHDRAMKEFGHGYVQDGYEYDARSYTGAELLFLQLKNNYC